MADNGIDFGQSSQVKYSLGALRTPTIAGQDIARDYAQAVQVGANIGNYLQQDADKANQAKYFNANIEFQNLQYDQQNALNDAGYDLNKQREVLNNYNERYKSLADKYELNDKYRATLGGAVETHINGLEAAYGKVYNARKQDEAIGNATTVIANNNGNDAESSKLVLDQMRTYLKENTGLSDREIGDKIAGAYINAKAASLDDPNNITLDVASQMTKDLKTVLEGYDPKITTSTLYKEGLRGFQAIQEHARAREEDKIKDLVLTGSTPEKAMFKIIDDAVKSGVIKTYEQAGLYKSQYRDRLVSIQEREERRQLLEEGRTAKDFQYAFELSGKSESEAKAYLDKKVASGEIRQDRADFMLRHYSKDLNKEAVQRASGALKEEIAKLKVSSGTGGYSVQQVEKMMRATSTTNSLDAEDISYLKVHSYKVAYETTPKQFSEVPLFSIPADSQQEAKTVARFAIDDAFKKGDLSLVASLHSNYGVTGQLPNYFSTTIDKPVAFQEVKQIYDKFKQAFPSSYKELVGTDTAAKIGLLDRIKRMSGATIITPNMILEAEEQYKQPVTFDQNSWNKFNNMVTSNKVTDTGTFRTSIEDYMRLGKSFSDASKLALAEVTPNIYKTVNLSGLPISLNSKQKELLDESIKILYTDKNSLISGFAYNKGTNSMWYSTKDNMFAKEVLDQDGKGMSFDGLLQKLATESLALSNKNKTNTQYNMTKIFEDINKWFEQ